MDYQTSPRNLEDALRDVYIAQPRLGNKDSGAKK